MAKTDNAIDHEVRDVKGAAAALVDVAHHLHVPLDTSEFERAVAALLAKVK